MAKSAQKGKPLWRVFAEEDEARAREAGLWHELLKALRKEFKDVQFLMVHEIDAKRGLGSVLAVSKTNQSAPWEAIARFTKSWIWDQGRTGSVIHSDPGVVRSFIISTL